MTIVGSEQKIYYQVMYRIKPNKVGQFSICHNLGCFEDIRDAVSRVVQFYRKQPNGIGEIGIVETSTKDRSMFKPTKYKN